MAGLLLSGREAGRRHGRRPASQRSLWTPLLWALSLGAFPPGLLPGLLPDRPAFSGEEPPPQGASTRPSDSPDSEPAARTGGTPGSRRFGPPTESPPDPPPTTPFLAFPPPLAGLPQAPLPPRVQYQLLSVRPRSLLAEAEPPRLHQAFSRDRRVEQQLRGAVRFLSQGDHSAALEPLQAVLDSAGDLLIAHPIEEPPLAARQQAAELLRALPPSGREAYETLYGGLAERSLVAALAGKDEAALEQVLRRYGHTQAGRRAALLVAARALDRGQVQRAAAIWRDLWADRWHRSQLGPAHLLRGALTLARAGDHELAQEIAARAGTQPVTLAGEQATAAEHLLTHHTALAALNAFPFQGRQHEQDASHPVHLVAFRPHDVQTVSLAATTPSPATPAPQSRSGLTFVRHGGHGGVGRHNHGGSPPVPSELAWEAPLSNSESRHIDPLVTAWGGYQTQNGLPLATAQLGLIVGPELLLRDFDGIRCVDASTGQLHWHHATLTALSREISATTAPIDGNPDPGGIKRLWIGNALLGRMTTDGSRLFFIDGVESRWNPGNVVASDGQDAMALARQSNRLVALDLAGRDTPHRVLWEIGGPRLRPEPPAPAQANTAQAIAPQVAAVLPVAAALPNGAGATSPGSTSLPPALSTSPLAGHFILGAPAVVDGQLVLLSEFDHQLHVSAVEAASGALRWSRAVALVSTPVWLDQQRYALSATPVVGAGVVIVPTHSGVLLGLDLLDGAVRWGHAYDDAEQLQLLGAWPNNTRTQLGHHAFPNEPLVHAGRVVYLPPHSADIHCVDARTGKACWSTRREDQDVSQAIEQVVAAEGDTVLVVGRLRCRGLSLASGRELWSRPFPTPPAGRGARQGDNYLVPLANGSIQSIEIVSGHRANLSIAPRPQLTGNLVVGPDVVVGLSAGRVQAWPQAVPLLAKLDRDDPLPTRRPETRLLAAHTWLALGQATAAKAELRQILDSDQMTEATHQAEALLRELLFVELREESADKAILLAELDALIGARADRGRFLVHRVLHDRDRGNIDGLFDASSDLLNLRLGDPLVLDHEPSLSIAPEAWVRAVLSRDQQVLSTDPARLATRLESHLSDAVSQSDEPRLRHLSLLSAYPDMASRASLSLARSLRARGKFQAAELRLLACRQVGDDRIAALATRELADLLSERGLFHEAALLWGELETRYAEVLLEPGLTGLSFVHHADRTSPTWQAWNRFTPRSDFQRSPVIRETRWINSSLQTTYNGSGIQYLPTPRNSSFDLFDKGRGTGGLLMLVDRQTGYEHSESIRIPARYYYPTLPGNSFVGHLLPLGSLGAVHGVSLLDREVAWTMSPPGLVNRADAIRVGPAGPTYAVFQCRQHLFAVDPSTGDLLWQRTDLEGQAGLQADGASGLFGDAQVLCLFRADRSHYTLYDTTSGMELRRGVLDADRRQYRRAVGRNLVYMTAGTGGTSKRLRIWDPLSNHLLLDEPAEALAELSLHSGAAPGTRAYQFVRGADELAYITSDRRLKIVDIRTGDLRVSLDLRGEIDGELAGELVSKETEKVGLFRVCVDHDRYLLNVQTAPHQFGGLQATFIISDATLPAEHFQGNLAAIDRGTGELLWVRNVDNRSLIHLPEFRLPVLVLACRKRHDQTQLSGELLVLDARTGAELGRSDRLLPDRLLQCSYDRDTARIQLRGARTEIELDFAPPAPRAMRSHPTGGPIGPEGDAEAIARVP
jgi:outer membrane protein assembly factor BamB